MLVALVVPAEQTDKDFGDFRGEYREVKISAANDTGTVG